MIVGLAGHPSKVDNMERALRQMDRSLEIVRLEFEGLPGEPQTEPFRRLQKTADIVIVAGYYDYLFFTGHVFPKAATGFAARDILALYRGFLEASTAGYDIRNISIDGYREEEVREIYEEIGGNFPDQTVCCYKEPGGEELLSEKMVDRLVRFHSETYRAKHLSVCITGISLVSERLKELGIPCMLVSSTYENVRIVYEKLRLEYFLKAKGNGSVLYLYMEVGKISGREKTLPSYYPESGRLKAAEKILSFAVEIQAAVEEVAWGKFVLIADRAIFERETYSFRCSNLLKEAGESGNCRLSIGIGSSELIWEARENAEKALQKALSQDVSCAYVVYDNALIDGPILCGEKKSGGGFSSRCQKIAEASGLSVNTVLKFNAIVEKYRSNVFTVNELTLIYGCSLRSMYRMVEKLENCGYIEEEGKKMVKTSGRPSRILKINF